MEKNLFVVPTNHVHQFWNLAEDHLQKAIDTGNGEFTADQLKQYVAQGQSTLLLIMGIDNVCYGALTVQWVLYPNDRVCYVTYLGGRGVFSCWEQFLTWIKNSGGTKLQCSTALPQLIRLYEKYKFKPKYTLMEYKL